LCIGIFLVYLLQLAMSFENFGLHESLLKVLPEIGFEKPTPIQQQAIPVVLAGKDLLGSAQTGTGKTAAFLLPILSRLANEPGQGCQVLILEPTRELALQVEQHAKMISKYTPFRSACVYGGVAFGPQEKAFAEGVEIIAATPGRLLDHLRQGNARFNTLRILVLDEVDRMLDMGFLPDVRSILRQLPENRQTLFFSATVPSEIGRLADGMLQNPVHVAITPERKTAEGITQQVYPVPDHLKPKLLELLLSHEHVTSALVFTRTKQGADKVCAVVERRGLPVNRIHGDLSQGQRLKALAQFKDGEVKFLVATDIAARGIDVEGISHVINYDLPDSPEDYTHRIGRTARAGETGHAYSLFSPRDAAALAGIERHLGQKLEKITMPEFNYNETLGVQHEVRQGHNVRDFEDLGTPGAVTRSDKGLAFKDEDEKASLLLLFTPTATAEDAESPQREEGGRGRDQDERGGRRRRRGRGGRDSRDGRESHDDARGRGEERGQGSRPGFGSNRTGQAEHHDPDKKDRHQANAAMSATDVLRKASDQKAVVSSDMMDLRPRMENEAPVETEERRLDGGEGDNGGRRRRRRRGRGGRGGEAPAQAQGGSHGQASQHAHPQAQGHNRDFRAPRERGGQPQQRDGRGDRDRDRRQQRWQGQGTVENNRSQAPKPSLWQRLKNTFGLGSGGGSSLGDKW